MEFVFKFSMVGKDISRQQCEIFSLFFPESKTSVVYSTERSKAVVPVSVLLFVALWLTLRSYFLYVLPCVICSCVFPCLGKKELILVLFVRLFDLRLFGFVCFLFLLKSGKGCGL